MKGTFKILFILYLAVITRIGYANVLKTDGKRDKTETQNLQQTNNQKNEPENFDEETVIEQKTFQTQVDQDSIEDDSVNKYNFIFYFLYKFKYDHEDTP